MAHNFCKHVLFFFLFILNFKSFFLCSHPHLLFSLFSTFLCLLSPFFHPTQCVSWFCCSTIMLAIPFLKLLGLKKYINPRVTIPSCRRQWPNWVLCHVSWVTSHAHCPAPHQSSSSWDISKTMAPCTTSMAVSLQDYRGYLRTQMTGKDG